MSAPELDELRLAWRRTRADMGQRGFVVFPRLADWIELDLDQWLTYLCDRLLAGYEPSAAVPCYEPKPGWMLRPGAVLSLEDEVVYNLLAGRLLPFIWKAIGWAQGDPDLAYQLAEKRLNSKAWVLRGTRAHKAFRRLSLERLTPDITHVVTTDITGFYENIDIDRLLSDLSGLAADKPDLELLSKCLRRWAIPRGKGVPQGYSASDILAKLYINPIDLALRNDGVVHLRYVDDIRVFCRSRRDAKIVIRRLTELMSRRGLNLQSAKTKIHTKADAESEFRGLAQMLEDIEKQLAAELAIEGIADDYDFSGKSFKELRNRRGAPPEVLERSFRDMFPLANEGQFDKSLFHFLLGRLAVVGSPAAVDYCIASLRQRPEETRYILDYLAEVAPTREHLESILDYMRSDEAIYDYQLYQLLRWFLEQQLHEQHLLQLARRWAVDHNRDLWLRVYAISYLGAFGDQADLEQMEAAFGALTTELEKATCVEALSRLETNRRNAFYGRVSHDGPLIHRAVRRVRTAP